MREIVLLGITIVALVGMIASISCMVIVSRSYAALRRQSAEFAKINADLKEDIKKMSTEYSEGLLKYIETFTTQITVLRFQEFIDGHQIDKITAGNVKNLISEISTSVHDSLNEKLIDFDHTLFNREFVEQYIVQIVVYNVKRLLDRNVSDVDN